MSFLPPGDLPDPEVEPASLASPALASRFFTTEPPGKPKTTTGPSSSILYLKKKKKNLTNSKGYIHPMFIAALFTVAKIQKQNKFPSTDEWMKKWCKYMH